MSFFFSFLSFLVFLQLERERERERERGYITGIGRNSFKVYLSYFDGPLWRIFPLLRANRLCYFSTGLKIWLLVRATFRLPLPGALALGSLAATSVQQLIFFLPTSADGRSSHFRPRAPANHLASLFFSLVRRFVRATICHPSQVTEYR